MKRFLPYCQSLLALAVIWTSGCASAPPKPVTANTPLPQGRKLTVRTTAYTHSEAGGHKNAVDGRLHFGGSVFSAASDWSWLPLGTEFLMCSNGRRYVIEDYGSALVGRQTIDLYVPTRREMNQWGVRHEQIQILSWGSPAMSLKLLQGRQGNGHVRRMVTALRRDAAARR